MIAWERLRVGKKVVTASHALHAIKALKLSDKSLIRKLEGMQPDTQVTFESLGMDTKPAPWFKALERINYYDNQYLRTLLQRHGPSALSEKPRIKLSTIHSAKGAEADHVVLLTEMSQRCQALLDSHPGSEERVFYVGVTRARQTLALVGSGNPLFPKDVEYRYE